jgi:hypothetical protein
MRFFSISSRSDQALSRFEQLEKADTAAELILLFKKIELCDYKILLIADDALKLQDINGHFDPDVVIKLTKAWQSIRGKGMTDLTIQMKAWEQIDQIGESIPGRNSKSPRVRRFRNDPNGISFFILISGKEPSGLPLYELSSLCNLSQITNGSLPIHAAGVIHNHGLYIFAGVSGAGKSTIASLSSEIGNQVLDEDQILIHLSNEGYYIGDAWGYGLKHYDRPIRAIFSIIQDDINNLIPLGQSRVAHLLFERHNDIVKKLISDDLLIHSFRISSSIARQVPGYELHFYKHPDFWKLIDEQRLS